MASENQTSTLTLLKSLKIGMWNSSKNDLNWLLILPKNNMFVFIVEKGGHSMQKSRSFPTKFFKQLTNHSPFNSSLYKDSEGCVFVFEVDCDRICGIDYSHPLVRDGRLCLEAKLVRKREFTFIEDALDFYSGTAPFGGEATPASLEMLFGCSPTKRHTSSDGLPQFAGTTTPLRQSTSASPELSRGQLKARTNLLNRISASMAVGQQDAVMFLARRSVDALSLSSTDDYRTTRTMSEEYDGDNNNTKMGKDDGYSSPRFPTTTTTRNHGNNTNTNNIVDDDDEDETPRFSSKPIKIKTNNRNRNNNNTHDNHDNHVHNNNNNTDDDDNCMYEQQQPLSAEEYFSDASETAVRYHPHHYDHQHRHNTNHSSNNNNTHNTHNHSVYPLPLRQSASEGNLLNHTTGQQDKQPSTTTTTAQRGLGASTTTTKIYEFRLITAFFDDPHLPNALRPVIENNERLLKLYESGLPSWSIFLPTYGFYYRPWLRSITWVLFYAFSFFSLAIGFYDLYKTLPGLQLLLNKLASSMWLPPAAILQWIETHAQIRLSILLTYMFGKSEMLVYILKIVSTMWQSMRVAAEPIIIAVAPTVVFLSQCAKAMNQGMKAVFYAGISPFIMLIETIYSTLIYPFMLLFTAFKQLHGALSVLIVSLISASSSLASTLSAASTTAKAGRSLAQASPSAMSWFASMDAFETVRASLVRAARSFQSVWRFIMHVSSATVRHRLTLSRRAARTWRRVKGRLHGVVMVPVDAVMVLIQWVVLHTMSSNGNSGISGISGINGIHGDGVVEEVEGNDSNDDINDSDNNDNGVCVTDDDELLTADEKKDQ